MAKNKDNKKSAQNKAKNKAQANAQAQQKADAVNNSTPSDKTEKN